MKQNKKDGTSMKKNGTRTKATMKKNEKYEKEWKQE
jgi:hypothetical protein